MSRQHAVTHRFVAGPLEQRRVCKAADDPRRDDELVEQLDDEFDELLTLAEVANLLRVAPATPRYWRHQHTGPASFRPGRHVRYYRDDVNSWVRAKRQSGDPGAA